MHGLKQAMFFYSCFLLNEYNLYYSLVIFNYYANLYAVHQYKNISNTKHKKNATWETLIDDKKQS